MWSPTRSPSVGENMSPIGAWMSYQVTDTLRAASTLTVQVAPDELSQPDRDGEEPDGPLAVSCTVVPLVRIALVADEPDALDVLRALVLAVGAAADARRGAGHAALGRGHRQRVSDRLIVGAGPPGPPPPPSSPAAKAAPAGTSTSEATMAASVLRAACTMARKLRAVRHAVVSPRDEP